MGAIIAGAVGGVVTQAAVAAIVLCVRRKKKPPVHLSAAPAATGIAMTSAVSKESADAETIEKI